MEKKYELTPETIQVDGHLLYRIRALRNFGRVKAGEFGGFIESEDNLSHKGNCWVYDDAQVYDDATVCHNAKIEDTAKIFGNACVYDKALVYDEARVYGDAKVYDDARVYEDAQVFGDACIRDRALIGGEARVCGNADVFGYAIILGDVIKANSDYIVFKNWWSSGRYFTWTRSNNVWNVGCFIGTAQELVDKAYKDSEESGKEYQRIVNYVQDILGLPHLNQQTV